MQRLDELIAKRDQVADWYNQRLAEIPGIEAPTIAKYTSRVSWFVYVVRFAPGLDRDEIAKKLGDLGIPARPYFLPIHLQPYMVERFGYQEGTFPVTEDLGRRGLGAALLGSDGRRTGGTSVPGASGSNSLTTISDFISFPGLTFYKYSHLRIH